MELTPRLKKIAKLIPEKSFVADIGTDHAYLPVYCVLNGISEGAVAADINEGPLKSAFESVSRYGLESKIELRLSDGLSGLKKNEADTIVIAGMGGLLIRNILEAGKEVLSEDMLLILQPMIAAEELRSYLYNNNFAVENEYLASEGNKLYNIICARYAKKCEFDCRDIFIGRNLKNNSPELYKRYIEYKSGICKKIILGLEKAAERDEELISFRKSELAIYEKEVSDYEG